MDKTCSRCTKTKARTEFYNHGAVCKECIALRSREYRATNKVVIKARKEEYRRKNKDKVKARISKWRDTNREHVRSYFKDYREANKPKHRLYMKDPQRRLHHNVSSLVRHSLLTNNINKNRQKWIDLLGYTLDDLRAHLESHWLPGMTWDNYGWGKGKWQVDHCTPMTWFRFKSVTDPDFKSCWALTNLQPLWYSDNVSKRNHYAHPPKDLKPTTKCGMIAPEECLR